jgi:hypothetical protein
LVGVDVDASVEKAGTDETVCRRLHRRDTPNRKSIFFVQLLQFRKLFAPFRGVKVSERGGVPTLPPDGSHSHR